MATSARCHTQKAPQNPPPLIQNGNIVFQAHHVGWIITGFFAIISTVTSVWLINKHLQWYTNKREQRFIVRILFMVPIYSLVSFASYLFWNDSTPLLLLRDCYESTVLTSFFYLLLVYLSPDPEQQQEVFRKNGLSRENDAEALKRGDKPKKWLFPLGFIKSKPKDGLYFLQIMKWGILQYCVIRPTTTVVAIILDYVGLYCEDSWSPGWGHVYITTLVSISVSIAMYCLLQLYFPVSTQLAPKKPILKLVAIKAVVFLTFWQASLLSLLETFGVVKNTQYMTADDITIGIAAILETFEMTIIAFLHIKAFSYKPYRPPDSVSSSQIPVERGKNKELGRPTLPAMSPMSSASALPEDMLVRTVGSKTHQEGILIPQRTPRLRSLAHAFDFRETFRELWAGCLYMTDKARGKETDGEARRKALRRELFLNSKGKGRDGRHLLNDEFDSAEKELDRGLGIRIGVSRHVVADHRDSSEFPLHIREGNLIKDSGGRGQGPGNYSSRRKDNKSDSSWWYAYGTLPVAAADEYDEPPPRSALRLYHGQNTGSYSMGLSEPGPVKREPSMSDEVPKWYSQGVRDRLTLELRNGPPHAYGVDKKMKSVDRSLPPVPSAEDTSTQYRNEYVSSGYNAGQPGTPTSPVLSSSSNTHTSGPDRVLSRLFLPSVDGESSAFHASSPALVTSHQLRDVSRKERSVKRESSPHLQVRTSVATLRRPVIIDATPLGAKKPIDSVAAVVDGHPSNVSTSGGLSTILRHPQGRIEDDRRDISYHDDRKEPGKQDRLEKIQRTPWEFGKDEHLESRFLYAPRPPPRPKRLTVPTPLAYNNGDIALPPETTPLNRTSKISDRPPSPHPNSLPAATTHPSLAQARQGREPVSFHSDSRSDQQQQGQHGRYRRSPKPRYYRRTAGGSDRLERSHARGAQVRRKSPQQQIPSTGEHAQPLPSNIVGQAY